MKPPGEPEQLSRPGKMDWYPENPENPEMLVARRKGKHCFRTTKYAQYYKISRTSVIEKSIPGGSLSPRMLLESGHFVQLMKPNGLSFHTSHWK